LNFVARLGDTTIFDMNAINKSMFTLDTDYYVRVFFSDNPTQNWAELTPAAALENPPFYIQNIENSIAENLVTNNTFISAITNQLGDIYNNTNQSCDTFFNGNRTIKRAHIPIGQNLNTSNVVDFLNAVFFPFVDATISLNVSPTLVEEGTRQTVTCSGNITANDETGYANTYVSSTTGADMPFTAQAGSYSVQQSDVIADSTYQSYVTTDNSGTISSGNRSINFVYPYFWGMTTDDLTAGGVTLYTTLPKNIVTQGIKTPTLNGNNQYIYFVFPADYPDLTSIKDQNNFEVLSSFTKYEVSVGSSGLDIDWNHGYKIYRNNNLTTVNNGQYTFAH